MIKKAKKILVSAGLSRKAKKILKLQKPSIRLDCVEVDEPEVSIGISKLGGHPNLPEFIQWPHNKSSEPLDFVAQLNMVDLVPYDVERILPEKGFLYFFYDTQEQPWGFDPEDRDGWKVIYYDGKVDDLSSVSNPKLGGDSSFEVRCLEFYNECTLPPWGADCLEDLDFTDDEDDLYYDLDEELTEEEGVHRIFGYPNQIQNEMQEQCQFASNGICSNGTLDSDPRTEELRNGVKDWRLLLQIDSENECNMCWGDSGRIYFWIKNEDLKNRFFDNVWLILQCG